MDMSNYPSARSSQSAESPASAAAPETPNLPALIDALSADSTRAPQTEFTRARQVVFLEKLSVTGSVRSAASSAQISHQTAYRARRASPALRLAWDAALVAARVNAESVLACRAIDGVEEKVFYHGEEVATRTRYSDRLLLAHLARLDRLTGDASVNAVAEDFDAALVRFEAGEEVAPAAPEAAPEEGGLFSPGQCNTRSMSPPCCAIPQWPRCRDCPHFPATERLLELMEEARPAHAPALDLLGDRWEAEACQMAAFEAGDADWWRYGEGMALYTRDARGMWWPASESAADEEE